MTARYALHDGGWVSCILGAPEWVNAEFRELFAEGVPSITPLVVRSEGPLEANCLSLAGSSAARVAQTQPAWSVIQQTVPHGPDHDLLLRGNA